MIRADIAKPVPNRYEDRFDAQCLRNLGHASLEMTPLIPFSGPFLEGTCKVYARRWNRCIVYTTFACAFRTHIAACKCVYFLDSPLLVSTVQYLSEFAFLRGKCG